MAGQFSDSDTEDLFASPSAKAASKSASRKAAAHPERPKTPKTPTQPQQQHGNSAYEASTSAEVREAALQRELQGVRQINELIEGVISTLDRAKGNMGTVSQTVNTASTLLNTWTRILSQTEHNQRLLLNPTWKGATQDLVDLENEAAQKQAAAERRAAEEERREIEAARRREEARQQREAGTLGRGRATATRGRTTRGRTVTRGTTATRGSTRGTYGVSSSGISGQRIATGIGRGFGSTRGRARGT
ncbi:DASH complex subunit Duo1-domain-containing protein [Apiospora kogelbergensis]|uniref:DASH complex subunit DUO1 n=1 Tax=Apiospora kogelbergensis TaxID=1337665 RepID=A0AAW0QYK7_9PEZI